jgi:hypothetical protein
LAPKVNTGGDYRSSGGVMVVQNELSIKVHADLLRKRIRARHAASPTILHILTDLSDEQLVAKYHEHEAIKINALQADKENVDSRN